MKNHKYILAFGILYLACWCHLTYALESMNEGPIPQEVESLVPVDHTQLEQRSAISSELDSGEDYDLTYGTDPEPPSKGHSIKKRESKPLYFTPAYCKTLGFCSLMPTLSAVCLMKCNFDGISLLKPFLGLLPELPMLLCQSVSTILASLPKQLYMNAFRIPNLRSFLKVLNVKLDDQIDFAKISANALPATMIKSISSAIFDNLKPAIKKLEIHDIDKKVKKNLPDTFKRFIGSPFTLNVGEFVNQKCDKTNFDDEAMMLIAAMKTRSCVMDILMPGYFAFNAAPKVAKTLRILPQLRAWNMPLIMFTGVRCCMVEFAISKRRLKCTHSYNILDRKHELPSQNGPWTVCNAIPSYMPIIPPTITIGPTLLRGRADDGSSVVTEEETTTVTASPCDDENKSDLEECGRTSLDDYSEEANQTQTEESTTADAEIESDEIVYF